MKKRIAIFASGTGSNAVNFINYFKASAQVEIALVLSNKADAPVLGKATSMGIITVSVTNRQAANGPFMTQLMIEHKIDFIVLAGYLRLIPTELINAFNRKMVNIHPSLLPKYGGKGMYGGKVHQAVIANQEPESGITIHYVNEVYDKGEIISQERIGVAPNDTPDSLAQKIHELEHKHFPVVVEKVLAS